MSPLDKNTTSLKDLLAESWTMGWPMILIMFFHFSIGLADAYVAGYLGTKVLAAVGYVGQLYWTLMILANGIAVGAVSMVSQAYGARSWDGVGSVTAHSILVGLTISGIITALALVYPDAIVKYAGMPDEIRDIAGAFLRIFSLVLIPTYLMIVTGGVLRASGRVRIAMVTSFLAASLNVVGDVVLAFGWGPIPAMGYQGIAWASAVATTVGMILNLSQMFLGPGSAYAYLVRLPQVRCLKNLMKLGFPTALQQVAWNAGTLMVYFLIGQIRGSEITALAAMSGGVRIEALIFMPIFAFSMASAVLTGNRLGSGDPDGARSEAKATAALCLAVIFVPSLLIFVFAPPIAGSLTSDQAVLDEIVRYLRINMLAMPLLAIGISLSGALQGAGDTIGTMKVIFAGMWLIRIPLILAVVYVLKADATAVWWSMTISITLMCGLLVQRFRGGAWIKASIDKADKSMLWEACLDGNPENRPS